MSSLISEPKPEKAAPSPAAAAGALSTLLRSALRGAQMPFAQYALKSDLSSLVSMARDHEANSLAPGTSTTACSTRWLAGRRTPTASCAASIRNSFAPSWLPWRC